MGTVHSHIPRLVPAGAVIGLLGIVLIALAGVAIRFVGLNRPTSIDVWWHDLLAASRNPVADIVAQGLNVVGGTFWMTVITAALVALLFFARRRREALTIGLTVALASGLCSILKLMIARPRPIDGIVDVTSDSYPSGHVDTAAAITIAVAIAFPRVWTRAIAVVWIIGMALGRTYLLVHWASDVAAAALLGLSVALLVSAAVAAIVSRATPGRRFLKEPSLVTK
ncbi:phosphatase PAP2 family protein [Salinibacterium sp.]|uniref:phosphatase PAP2 family protein n=1 Tax=Salinibacterium sp. TaxID=1915057 RepID=UPI00286C1FC8|nr:phosphatase PAP2 family protein [Salinibacterium sp.]